jgi:hypothetical protein
MFKDKQHFVEELAKSIQKDLNEALEKSLRQHMFQKGSTLHLKAATGDKKNSHKYTVHEHTADGQVKVHEDVPLGKLDSRAKAHSKPFRMLMGGESHNKKHDLYHSAKVRHVDVQDGSRKYTEERLEPVGEPHFVAEKKKD